MKSKQLLAFVMAVGLSAALLAGCAAAPSAPSAPSGPPTARHPPFANVWQKWPEFAKPWQTR